MAFGAFKERVNRVQIEQTVLFRALDGTIEASG